jgi:hypothetical protein
MRDNADLNHRAAEAKQALLMALKCANAAALDGSADADDLVSLSTSLEQAKRAKDMLAVLLKRLEFHRELARVMHEVVDEERSRHVIGLVRIGVDGGYDVTEVRKLVDQALGR